MATTAQAVFDTIAAAGESTAAGPPDSSAVALKAGPAAHLSSRQLTLGGQLPPLDQLRNLTVISITLTTPACESMLEPKRAGCYVARDCLFAISPRVCVLICTTCEALLRRLSQAGSIEAS